MTFEHVIMLTMLAIIILQRIYIRVLEKNQFNDKKMIRKDDFIMSIIEMPKKTFNNFIDDMVSLREQANSAEGQKCE